MTPLEWARVLLVGVGFFFSLVAVVGLVRLPDLYTRAHATSKADTLGTVLTLGGAALAFESSVPRAKLVVLAGFMLITSPTAAHAVTRAAYDQGVEVWTKTSSEDDDASTGGERT
mgnify:CR=1 FL=1